VSAFCDSLCVEDSRAGSGEKLQIVAITPRRGHIQRRGRL